MPRLLLLLSVFLLQTANLAAAQEKIWITAVVSGATVSWVSIVPATTAVPSVVPTTTPAVTTPSIPTRAFEPPQVSPTTSHSKVATQPAATHHTSHRDKHPHHHHKASTSRTSPTHRPHGQHSGGHSSSNQPSTGGGASRQSTSSEPKSTTTGPNRSLVVGLAVGFTLIALIIIAVVALFVIRRRKARGYASAASSINEEGKVAPSDHHDTPAPFAPDAQPTLPAVMALASARNSTVSLETTGSHRASGAPSEMQVSTPWVPKTRSRLSQLQQIQPASPPPLHHSIPRRPVGASSP